MAIQVASAEVAAEITRKAKVKVAHKSIRQLASAAHMNAVIQRETARSDRNGREFSLVLFRIRPGRQHALSSVRLARTILQRARGTDEVGWFDEQFLCAVLPDTMASGAWHFAEDVCAIIAERAPRPIYTVYSYPSRWMEEDRGDRSAPPPPPSSGHSQRRTPDRARAEVNDLIPHFLNGMDSELQQAQQIKPQPLERLLVKPMPWWKRTIDIVGASILVVLLSPLMLFAYLLIKIQEPKEKAIFTQMRAGLGGVPFKIYKFRTMIADAEKLKDALRKHSEQDGPAFKMKNDPRVTRVGRFLRKTSIDELPQLFNVLKGDMTLVGPRPLPIKESDNCQPWQRRRLDVTPGLTCIWQIRGRSTVSFAEWVRMDVSYIRRRTLLHDIRILLQTVPAVLLRRGAS